MRTFGIAHKRLLGAALSLGIFSALTFLVVKLNYGGPAHQFSGISAGTLIGAQDGRSVDYHVWRIYPENRQGLTVVIVTVNPKHFSRNDMVALASEFNKEFTSVKKLRVGLLDDDDTARLFVEGRISYPTYEKAERGRYNLDRAACTESIQFSTKRGKPRETVKLACHPPR